MTLPKAAKCLLNAAVDHRRACATITADDHRVRHFGRRSIAAGDGMSAAAVARLVRSGQVSASEVVQAAVARAEGVHPQLNAVAVGLYEEAVDAAVAFDVAGARRLPLAGVPISVKESFEVTGTPACGGVEALAGARSRRDADVVAALRAAGAVLLAKGNLAQLLWFAETDNPVYGRTNNPWALDRSPGGSSGGDAALVAAGVVPLAIGTDIGGSVRIPAHCCGVSALKPTAGRLSLAGTLDERLFAEVPWIANQPGILAREPADIAIVLRALDPGHAAPAAPVTGLRVGVFRDNGVFAPSASVRRAIDLAEAAAARAGAVVVAFTPPAADHALALFDAAFRADGGAGLLRMLDGGPAHPRVAAAIADARDHAADPPGGEGLEARIAQYRRTFARALDAQALDAVICPAYPVPAVPHGTSGDVIRGQSYTSLWNLLGYPAGVVPVTTVTPAEDPNAAGLPVGAQVAGREWREDAVLGLMHAIGGGQSDRLPS